MLYNDIYLYVIDNIIKEYVNFLIKDGLSQNKYNTINSLNSDCIYFQKN